MTARIDLAGKDVGDYTVPVSITLPQGYRLVNDVSISVHLRERASASSESAGQRISRKKAGQSRRIRDRITDRKQGGIEMISKKIKITNPSGLHLRPAGNLCNTAGTV